MSDGAQLELIDSAEVERATLVEEGRGSYTGERLFRRRPAVYAEVVRLLGEGASLASIERLCGVSHHTISAVAIREPELVAERRAQVAGTLTTAAQISAERLVEELPNLKVANLGDAQRLAVIAGIASDKALTLAGEPTAIVRHESHRLEDVRDAWDAIDVTPSPTGLGEDAAAQKAGDEGAGGGRELEEDGGAEG